MAQVHPVDIRRNLPIAQQLTQRLADQFNADEQRFREAGIGIEPCNKPLKKRKRKPRKKSSSSATEKQIHHDIPLVGMEAIRIGGSLLKVSY